MTAAILTASIGNFDEIKGIPEQSIPVEYFPYFDNNLPFPLPNLNNRLKSKYVKIQSHRFLNYDYFIWVDGRVEIHADTFAEEMIKALGDGDVGIFKHKERETIFDELDFINNEIATGNKYLVPRYANQCMKAEYDFLRSNCIDPTLYACTVFIRRNTPKINEAFNEWWRRCIEFSYFDQAMFSYAMQDLNVVKFDRDYFNRMFEIGRHL